MVLRVLWTSRMKGESFGKTERTRTCSAQTGFLEENGVILGEMEKRDKRGGGIYTGGRGSETSIGCGCGTLKGKIILSSWGFWTHAMCVCFFGRRELRRTWSSKLGSLGLVEIMCC
jgi:hypothetical protein